MDDFTIHPSMKSVWAAYLLAGLIAVAGIFAIYEYIDDKPAWVYLIPLGVLLPALNMHLKRSMVTLHLNDDHLTVETGFFSRTQRTVDTAKIQDVTVQQSFGQRLMGVGDLMVEDSGQSGGMAIRNLDRPREIADAIINSSKKPRRPL